MLPDRRGHGRSDRPSGGYDIDTRADDLASSLIKAVISPSKDGGTRSELIATLIKRYSVKSTLTTDRGLTLVNAPPDPQQDPRRWWALSALALGGLLVSLDLTVLNVALPSLAVGLKANTSDLQWFANAYNLVFAALMLPAGLLGDRYGRKKLLVAALVVFGLASAGCAFSTSTGELIGARATLGLGAAFMLPLGMAQLPVLFTTEERGRALTIWITANAVGTPIGPIVGGILLDHFW